MIQRVFDRRVACKNIHNPCHILWFLVPYLRFALIVHETLPFFAWKCCPNEIRPTPLGECTLPHLHFVWKTIGLRNGSARVRTESGMQKHTYSLSYSMVPGTIFTLWHWIYTKRYPFCFKKVVQMTSDPPTLGNAPGKCTRNHWFVQGFCDSSNGWRQRKTYIILVIFNSFWAPIGALEQNPSKALQFVL